MKFKNFELIASLKIINPVCGCGHRMQEVDNGWFSVAFYCKNCESVYEPKLVKIPSNKINKETMDRLKSEATNSTQLT